MKVTIYGSAYTTATIDEEEWEDMSDRERTEWARRHWGSVTPTEPSSYRIEERDEEGPI